MVSKIIHPLPLLDDLKGYQAEFLKRDLFAALSVALLSLPQAMAYAFVAGLPPSAGIFAAIFGTIFTASFGASPWLISGPSNTVAILIQSGVSQILETHYPAISGIQKDQLSLQLVLQITLLIGVFQIFGGVLRLGRITQFASRSVIGGYVAGAALVITITQLFYFFGIAEMEGSPPLYHQGGYLFTHLFQLNIPTTLLGIGALALLIFFHRFSDKIPGAAIVFILAALVTFFLNKTSAQKITLLEDLGPLNIDLPQLTSPLMTFRSLLRSIPLAFAISLFCSLEATSIGRSYARPHEPPYSDNQEIYGLGVSNLLSSFLGAMPSSGSFSRTALNVSTKAKTRLSAILSGIFVFILVMLFGFWVSHIPLAALSALMLLTAYTMVNFDVLYVCLKATLMDRFVVLATFLSVLFFPLDVSFYIGIVLSIVLYLKQAGIPLLIEYTFTSKGKLRPMEKGDRRPDPRICILQAEGELFFGAAEPLHSSIREIAEDEQVKVIILQIFNARHIDASITLAIKQIDNYLQKSKKTLLLSGVNTSILLVMENAGLLKKIGRERIFLANEKLPGEPTRNAYAYAKSLVV